MPTGDPRQISNIGNYYGELQVKDIDGKFFWSIGNYDGGFERWEEIPESLYRELIAHDDAMKESGQDRS